MKAIVKYKTISENSVEELDKSVNTALKKDWQPYGEMQLHKFPHTLIYVQTMIKYGKTVAQEMLEQHEEYCKRFRA